MSYSFFRVFIIISRHLLSKTTLLMIMNNLLLSVQDIDKHFSKNCLFLGKISSISPSYLSNHKPQFKYGMNALEHPFTVIWICENTLIIKEGELNKIRLGSQCKVKANWTGNKAERDLLRWLFRLFRRRLTHLHNFLGASNELISEILFICLSRCASTTRNE